jgi:hypothetical protein
MINVIEKNNYKWSSGDKISIKYVNFDGKQRTYRPDFIIENKTLIEIKPKRLMKSPENILKKKAAIKYCNKKGLNYKMIDIKQISFNKTISLYKSGDIVLIDRYKNKLNDIIIKLERSK